MQAPCSLVRPVQHFIVCPYLEICHNLVVVSSRMLMAWRRPNNHGCPEFGTSKQRVAAPAARRGLAVCLVCEADEVDWRVMPDVPSCTRMLTSSRIDGTQLHGRLREHEARPWLSSAHPGIVYQVLVRESLAHIFAIKFMVSCKLLMCLVQCCIAGWCKDIVSELSYPEASAAARKRSRMAR